MEATRRRHRSWWRLGLPPERWLEILLALLVLFVFVGRPLVAEFPRADFAIELVFSLVLASGAAATTRATWSIGIAVIALVTIVVGWLAWGTESVLLRELRALVAVVYCATLATAVLAQVFRSSEVRRNQIEGAIAAYLLIGLTFAFAYSFVFLLRADAFTFAAPILAGDRSAAGRLFYFSFVTLTTMGYGDITPTISTTEMMATLEALVGQLFPAILLARLVSMELHQRALREQHRTAQDA
jgi:hypothetical protein